MVRRSIFVAAPFKNNSSLEGSTRHAPIQSRVRSGVLIVCIPARNSSAVIQACLRTPAVLSRKINHRGVAESSAVGQIYHGKCHPEFTSPKSFSVLLWYRVRRGPRRVLAVFL